MRLTLRTLLAYTDEILEPSDREELAKKVESSEFARDLIHRTKDTMRRLRLSAPQVVGTGMGLDPNTVAEYLDNVLPPDSVADFERICLESEVHLAEVASAHHVLTMVLGEPAEVDPVARQRMYLIPAESERRKRLRIEPAHSSPAAAHGFSAVPGLAAATPPPHNFPPPSVASATHTRRDAIPDYLRASAWTRHGTLLAACAAVLLLAVSWLVYVSLGGWSGGAKQVASGSSKSTATNPQESAEPLAESSAFPLPSTSESPTGDLPATTTDATGGVTESEPTASSLSAAPPRLVLPAMGSARSPAAPQEPAVVAVGESAYGYGSTPAEPGDRYAGDTSQAPALASAAPAPTELAGPTVVPSE